MSSPAALYRRYRPDTFKDVIGQEHVTEPLMTALRKDRVNHAYLFSGPRGCGKTTSARILARCLNCEQGPTPDPCGVCPSCVELARGGAGSLDVIEIDAASHGGVDDARDLRERATFAPVRDRYKIFIIDEAHMVTSAGFNALLKIVEEPPEHIKFIFATTEPDKVIGTIRSRTHHYPFRLVPPEPLLAYLEQLCTAESVPVAPGVLSLVVRAGGGSVRDSLSVLDQLMAGAGPNGLDYELAVALLGYTHAALLDDVVDAVAAGDSGTVFRAVDRVVQTGHDPRRFVEDLLERFRDLIIVQALPDAAESILRGIPADQLARMRVQAQSLGAAELSRAADVTNEAFNEMTGATSPRLHLELLCARLMLPGADATERGWAARVDRLERRLAFAHDGGESPAAVAAPAAAPATRPRQADAQPRPEAPAPVATPTTPPAPAPQQAPATETTVVPPAGGSGGIPAEPQPESPTSVTQAPTSATQAPTSAVQRPTSATQAPTSAAQSPTSVTQAPTSATQSPTSAVQAPTSAGGAAQAGGGSGSVEMFRRAWPEILDTLAKVKRSTWALVGPNASVAGFDGRTLALAFGTSGLASAFMRSDHADNLRRSIQQVLGVDCQIDAVTGGNGPGVAPTAERGAATFPKAPADPVQGTPVPDEPAGSPANAPAPNAPAPSAPAPSAPAPSAPAPGAPADDTAPTASQAPSEADIAWGLAPAPSPSTPTSSSSSGPIPPASLQGGRTPAPAREATAQVATSTPSRAASAPGPAEPYDDVPYSDEEPPNEWDEPYPDDEGYTPGRSGSRSTEARRTAGSPQSTPARAAQPPAPTSAAAPAPAGAPPQSAAAPMAAASPSSDPSVPSPSDPWSYARETSPGVWTVGAESNLAANHPDGLGQAPAPSPDSEPMPPASAAAPAAEATASQSPRASQNGTSPETAPGPAPVNGSRRLSMYERLSRTAAQRGPAGQHGQAPQGQAPHGHAPQSYVEDIPSADDEAIEESVLFGRAAVERILGGKLIEERALDGTVIAPR